MKNKIAFLVLGPLCGLMLLICAFLVYEKPKEKSLISIQVPSDATLPEYIEHFKYSIPSDVFTANGGWAIDESEDQPITGVQVACLKNMGVCILAQANLTNSATDTSTSSKQLINHIDIFKIKSWNINSGIEAFAVDTCTTQALKITQDSVKYIASLNVGSSTTDCPHEDIYPDMTLQLKAINGKLN